METWKGIPGFPDYEVSDLGRIRSWRHRVPGERRGEPKVLRPALPSQGSRYCRVALRRDWTTVTHLVHRLVLDAFVGPCPDGMECRHMDGRATNNALVNLAWGTPKENSADSIRHGVLLRKGRRNPASKLTDETVRLIREAKGSNPEVGRRFGVSATTVSVVRNRKAWQHVA